MVVIIFYKTRITPYQSTVSRFNIIRCTLTRPIAVSPQYHTIIAIKPHAPSSHSVFSVRPNNIVTFLRPQCDFVPRRFLGNLSPCELTTKTVWQTCSPRRQPEVRIASRGQGIVPVAPQGDRFKCISCVPSCQPQTWSVASRDYWGIVSVVSKGMGVQNVQQLEGSYTVYSTLFYTQLYGHIQNCWMI